MPHASAPRRILLVVVIAAAAAMPAHAETGLGALKEFGVLGTWALDCGQDVTAGEHEIFAMSSPDAATLTFSAGAPYRDRTYIIRSAERIAPDRLELHVGLERDAIALDIVLLKSAGTLRIWSSRDRAGRIRVMDGIITGNGRVSPSFKRCGP